MRRRDFVKAIVAVPVTAMPIFGQNAAPGTAEKTSEPQSKSTAAAPPAPETAPKQIEEPQSFGFQSPAIPSTIPDEIATTEQHYFDAEQMATLRKLGDILLPPMNGYPGSTQASAPEFIDFLISVSPVERQKMYRFWPGTPEHRGAQTIRHSLCAGQRATSRCAAATVAANLDGRSSADRTVCTFHQCGA